MSVQSEAQLETALIKRLACLGWTEVPSDELAKLSGEFGPMREPDHPSPKRSGVVDLASKRIL